MDSLYYNCPLFYSAAIKGVDCIQLYLFVYRFRIIRVQERASVLVTRYVPLLKSELLSPKAFSLNNYYLEHYICYKSSGEQLYLEFGAYYLFIGARAKVVILRWNIGSYLSRQKSLSLGAELASYPPVQVPHSVTLGATFDWKILKFFIFEHSINKFYYRSLSYKLPLAFSHNRS